MNMIQLRSILCLLVFAYFGWASPAVGDAVVDWNAIAVQANAAAIGRPGTVAILDFAMVHGAVYDAVRGYDGRFEPYCVEITGPTGSPVAAVAKSAHDVLVNLYPAQTASLDIQYSNYLVSNGLSEADEGVAIGQQAAACMVALRTNDGRFPAGQIPFFGGTEPGMWRPTPPTFAAATTPWLSAVAPFTLTSPSQFRAVPPHELLSEEYTSEYNEVRAIGALLSSTRTADQTDLAYFWADPLIPFWNRALRNLSGAHINNLTDSARLFALANFAMADALITSWECKFFYVYWRPITAIHEGDFDGNPDTDGDTSWLPLINTPPYPEYTSGANNLTGAVTRILALFFGTNKMAFSLTSNFPLAINKTRSYTHFSDAAKEVVDARIYQGIHFRLADHVARNQGKQVAQYVFSHFVRPVQN